MHVVVAVAIVRAGASLTLRLHEMTIDSAAGDSTRVRDESMPVPRGGEEHPSASRMVSAVVRDMFSYRELLLELTARDLRIRYKQSVLGVLWAILTPLVVVLAGAIIKAAFTSMSGRSVAPLELAGLAVKSIGWTFFVGALGFGTASLTANLALVTKVYFPRELLPVSTVVTQAVDSSIGAMALLVLFPLFGIGHLSGLGWLLLIVLLLTALTTAIVLLASCANVFYRDVKHVVQLVTSFGIFFSPVFFDLDAFGTRGVRVLVLNPLTGLLEGARLAIVTGHDLATPLIGATGSVIWSPGYLVYAAVAALGSLLLSMIIFRRASANFADFV